MLRVKIFFTYIKQLNRISEKSPSSAKHNGFFCTPSPLLSPHPLPTPTTTSDTQDHKIVNVNAEEFRLKRSAAAVAEN